MFLGKSWDGAHIETVGAIFREYKPWVVLLMTQCSKSSKILALSLGLFDLQGLLLMLCAKRCLKENKTTFTKWKNFNYCQQ
jgi:hypothetical protein